MDRHSTRRRMERVLIPFGCAFLLAYGAAAQAPAASQPSPAANQPAAISAGPAPAAQSNGDAKLPAWDVSTIKPGSSDERGSMIQFTPDGVKYKNVSLWTIVREAFRLEDDHLFGGPGWSKTSMFDIEAKVAPEDAPKLKDLTFAQRQQMVVSLVEERFGLKYHHETRDLPLYDLVVAKGGSKLTPSKPDPPAEDGDEKH